MRWREIIVESFESWFAGSKILTQKGEPRVVYHGTKGNFDSFRDQNTLAFGPGFYFTNDPVEASKYAKHGKGKGANVMPVYLRMVNPKVYNNEYDYWKEMGIQPWDSGRFFGHNDLKAKLTQRLKNDGHDGIVISVRLELPRNPSEYIVFSASQIKSAIGNSGTFDMDDSSILN